jgi:hypothetical protein
MENRDFLNAYELIKVNLFNLDVNRIFNSIGSNIFIEFGKGKELLYKNGRKTIQKEWSIWVSNASWRITKRKKYIVGSGDITKLIQNHIKQLMGKRFLSLQFSSTFLDAEFNFDDGYQLTTFFNWKEEDQWSLFLPDNTNISVDCSDQESIKNVRKIANNFKIIENYTQKKMVPYEINITRIVFDNYDQLTICFENKYSIILKYSAWRLEKDEDYVVGYLDNNENDFNNKISQLIGKKLKQVDIANSMMDARFKFEDGFVLKIFTCCNALSQWQVFSEDFLIFDANIK